VTFNGEVEGPGTGARSEPRAHIVFQRPRRHYRLSRPCNDCKTALGLSLPAVKISTSTKSAAAAATSVQIVMFIIEEWCAKGARV